MIGETSYGNDTPPSLVGGGRAALQDAVRNDDCPVSHAREVQDKVLSGLGALDDNPIKGFKVGPKLRDPAEVCRSHTRSEPSEVCSDSQGCLPDRTLEHHVWAGDFAKPSKVPLVLGGSGAGGHLASWHKAVAVTLEDDSCMRVVLADDVNQLELRAVDEVNEEHIGRVTVPRGCCSRRSRNEFYAPRCIWNTGKTFLGN